MATLSLSDLESYLIVKKGLSPQTVKNTIIGIKVLDRFLGANNLDYTPASIERFLLTLKQGNNKTSTINNYILHIKRLHDYFVDRGYSLPDFTKGLTYAKEERELINVLTLEEIQLLIDHMGKYSLLTMFLALTGCRIGEALSVKVKHFDSNGYITFTQTKTKVARRVGVVDPLFSKLKTHIYSMELEDRIFAFAKPAYQKHLHVVSKKVGIKKRVYPHLFRHSFITSLITEGIPITVVGAIVGHSDINSTAWYTHLAENTLRQAVYKHPLVRGNTPVSEVLKNTTELINSLKLQDNKKFKFKLLQGSNSLHFELVALP